MLADPPHVLSPSPLLCTSAPAGAPPLRSSAAASRAKQLQQQQQKEPPQQQDQSLFGGMWPSEMEGLLQSRVASAAEALPGEMLGMTSRGP